VLKLKKELDKQEPICTVIEDFKKVWQLNILACFVFFCETAGKIKSEIPL
jgi:hypothetical protein